MACWHALHCGESFLSGGTKAARAIGTAHSSVSTSAKRREELVPAQRMISDASERRELDYTIIAHGSTAPVVG